MSEQSTKRFKPLRVLLMGSECTGKTTLGSQLVEHYQCAFVAEYAREYAEQALPRQLEIQDAILIARGQAKAEQEALRTATFNKTPLIIIDTDARMSWMYSELYFDQTDSWIVHRALHKRYDLILFTTPDGISWQQDSVRPRRDPRFIETSQLRYLLQMTAHLNEPFLPLSGSKEQRLEKAILFINTILSNQ